MSVDVTNYAVALGKFFLQLLLKVLLDLALGHERQIMEG